jgi:hypothetical protein
MPVTSYYAKSSLSHVKRGNGEHSQAQGIEQMEDRSDKRLGVFGKTQSKDAAASAHGFFDFGEPIRTLKHFARLGTVGGPDNAVLFH